VNLAVLTPDEDYVLVGHGEHVSIVDTETDAVEKTWFFGAPPLGISRVDRFLRRVLVTARRAQRVGPLRRANERAGPPGGR
jgi:hypothetical protein